MDCNGIQLLYTNDTKTSTWWTCASLGFIALPLSFHQSITYSLRQELLPKPKKTPFIIRINKYPHSPNCPLYQRSRNSPGFAQAQITNTPNNPALSTWAFINDWLCGNFPRDTLQSKSTSMKHWTCGAFLPDPPLFKPTFIEYCTCKTKIHRTHRSPRQHPPKSAHEEISHRATNSHANIYHKLNSRGFWTKWPLSMPAFNCNHFSLSGYYLLLNKRWLNLQNKLPEPSSHIKSGYYLSGKDSAINESLTEPPAHTSLKLFVPHEIDKLPLAESHSK